MTKQPAVICNSSFWLFTAYLNILLKLPYFQFAFAGEGAPKCLEFKRSQKAGCRSARHGGGHSFELFNEITHFVDASNIYGSSLKTLDLLRHGIRGKMEGRVHSKLEFYCAHST